MSDREALQQIQSIVSQALGVPVPVATPVPVPPGTPPSGGYVGKGMWIYGQNRFNYSLSEGNHSKTGTFTVPSDFPATGTVEFPESGAGVNITLNGEITSQDARHLEPGDYVLGVQLLKDVATASGSIGCAHNP